MKRYELLHMAFVMHLHQRHTSEAFTREGLNRSWPWILDYLADGHDGCIQRELSRHSHFDPASITAALVGMEEDGLIRRENAEGDKRALNVYLTEKGMEKQKKVQQILSETEEKALRGFTREECSQLGHMLQRIHENLENEDGES